MRLVLVRHGQTPSNVLGTLDTAAPGPGLTELGQRQAAALPAALEGESIAGIYVSRLRRTHLTAAPLASALGLDPQELPGLHEIAAGDVEGRSDRDAVRAYVSTFLAWAGGDLEQRMPGAETGEAFLRRFDDSIGEVEREHRDQTAVVFSHGASIRLWVQLRCRGIDPEFMARIELDNTGTAVLEGGLTGDGRGFELVNWRGAAAHLSDDTADDVTGEPAAEAIADAD